MKYTTFPDNALSNTFIIFSQLQNMKKKYIANSNGINDTIWKWQ